MTITPWSRQLRGGGAGAGQGQTWRYGRDGAAALHSAGVRSRPASAQATARSEAPFSAGREPVVAQEYTPAGPAVNRVPPSAANPARAPAGIAYVFWTASDARSHTVACPSPPVPVKLLPSGA